jgi:two-component system OmpR family response regulator
MGVTAGMKVLVIEDDPVIGKSLDNGLTDGQHSCVWVSDANRGLALVRKQKDDAIILGLSLHESSLGTLQAIRGQGILTPVIALTAEGAVEECVALLRAGADDCMAEPVAIMELLARLEVVCRRTSDRPATILRAGNLTLNLTNCRLNFDQQEIDLTPAEFGLAELLFRHHGKVVSREMLAERIGSSPDRSKNSIEVHMNRLRNKLRSIPEPVIATVRSRGYVLRSAPS